MKVITGKIVSAKMKNTVVVSIDRLHLHPIYKKYMKRTSKLKAHYDSGEYKEGDVVEITSVRPVAKEVFYKIVKKVS